MLLVSLDDQFFFYLNNKVKWRHQLINQ